jgi:GT2 family glycosyltransferase
VIDLSISVVNTSNWRYLQPCLKTIEDGDAGISCEVLVVDNVSTDGSAEKTRDLFPGVILSVNQTRYGFAKNNNINLRKSQGRYLMLLNDDTLVQPGTLRKAVEYLDAHPEVGAVGCRMINPDGSIQVSSARPLPTLWSAVLRETGLTRLLSRSKIWRSEFISKDDHDTVREIGLPQEAGMIVRSEVVRDVGVLDERFFMFGEGADWCRRIKGAGWKIEYLPQCPIVHFGDVTNKRSSALMYIQHYKSAYLYFAKESAATAGLYRWLVAAVVAMKYVVTSVRLAVFGARDDQKYVRDCHGKLLDMLLFRMSDPHYPFPT